MQDQAPPRPLTHYCRPDIHGYTRMPPPPSSWGSLCRNNPPQQSLHSIDNNQDKNPSYRLTISQKTPNSKNQNHLHQSKPPHTAAVQRTNTERVAQPICCNYSVTGAADRPKPPNRRMVLRSPRTTKYTDNSENRPAAHAHVLAHIL